jgi:hypothetical protein
MPEHVDQMKQHHQPKNRKKPKQQRIGKHNNYSQKIKE